MPLHDLGISERQETVYRALLADSSSGLPELASRTGTDEHTALACLADLAGIGVVRHCAEAPSGFAPRDPSVAIGELIERLEDEALRRHRMVSSVRTELAALTALHMDEQGGDASEVEALPLPEDIRERLAELSFFTRHSVWAIQPSGPHSRASRKAATNLDQRSLRRGVDMRIIYDESVLASEHGRDSLRQRVGSGVRVRVQPCVSQRLIIMDERVAVTQADPADRRRGALVVRQRGLLNGLLELFELRWDSAREVHFDDAVPTAPGAGDRVVLEQLAAGTTDEMAARNTGISVRQFRRRVARLMRELQADSRFQAGAVAAHRGWI